MNILMFGWEFPPHSSGGLGTACYGLTKGLSNKGVNVTFVVPKQCSGYDASHLKMLVADNIKSKNIKIKKVDSILKAYMTSESYENQFTLNLSKSKGKEKSIYGKNLFQEIYRYSKKAEKIAKENPHDVIHAHDWMTFKAGINAKKVSKKPLVLHIHATEFDRTGNNPNQYIYEAEKEGMHFADHIIAVSQYTKNKIIEHYDISPEIISVVHNAIIQKKHETHKKKKEIKTVLFLGRLTVQKGPDYFLYAAKKVLEKDPNVRFIIAGSGDMESFILNKSIELGISNKVLFAGFLEGEKINQAYQMADLYVMPSISEPFGITPLESLNNGTPVLISKQSGVSEVLTNCLKTDFWDTDEMANKVIAALNYKSLHSCLCDNGKSEVAKMNWDNAAEKCIDVYSKVGAI